MSGVWKGREWVKGWETGKGRSFEKILLMGDLGYPKFLLTGKNILEDKFTCIECL